MPVFHGGLLVTVVCGETGLDKVVKNKILQKVAVFVTIFSRTIITSQ